MADLLPSAKLIFTLGDLRNGWVHVHLETESSRFTTYISSVPNDGLGDFLRAVMAVLPYPGTQSQCVWSREPDSYKVTLSHLTGSLVSIQIHNVPDIRDTPDSSNTSQWNIVCELGKFARKVRLAYKLLLKKKDGLTYHERWGHPFLEKEYQGLGQFIASIHQ